MANAIDLEVYAPEEGGLDALIGSLYENLEGEEPWKDALERARIMLNASNAVLRISESGIRPRESIFAYGPKVDRSKIKDFEENFIRDYFPAAPRQGEVCYFQWEAVAPSNPKMEDLTQSDTSWVIVHCFESTNRTSYLLIASRESSQTAFGKPEGELLTTIGSHFCRALRIRTGLLRSQVVGRFQAACLDSLSITGLLIDESGVTTPLSDSNKALASISDALRLVNGRLHAVDEQDDARLQAIIRSILSEKSDKAETKALSLRRKSGKRELNLVVNLRRSMSAVSGRLENAAVVFVRDSEPAMETDIEVLCQLFSFTPAEARLAFGLAKGKRLDEVEKELNIRHNTARAHLRSMFLKADVSRQSELVHLLANSIAPLGGVRESQGSA